MDWSGWASFGVVATVLLTSVLVGAQLAGLTRLDIPLMLGHLAMDQFFALFYAAAFAELGRSGWGLGASFGVVHAAVAGAVLVPLLPTIHPRLATERAGPHLDHHPRAAGSAGHQLRVEHTFGHGGGSCRLRGGPGSAVAGAMT